MVDNVDITEGAGKTVRTDDIGGSQYQIIKLATGADGVLDGLIEMAPQAPGASLPVAQPELDWAAADTVTSGGGAAATLTYAAAPGVTHVISGVAWGYSTAPVVSTLTITDNAVPVFVLGVPAVAGIWSVNFNPPRRCSAANQALVITASAGGGAVLAYVNVLGHWTE